MHKDVNVVLDNNANILIAYIQALGVRVTKTSIRAAIVACPAYPELMIKDIEEILQQWHISLHVVEGEAIFHELCPPFISLHHVLPEAETNELSGRTLITGKEERSISYLKHGITYYCSMEEFYRNWSGYLIILDDNDEGGEPDYVAISAAEQAKAVAYRATIRTIPHFFTDEECEYVIWYCEQQQLFDKSKVLQEGTSIIKSYLRSSYNAYLGAEDDPVLKKLYDKITTCLQIDSNRLEGLQCVRYQPYQEFKPHYDNGPASPRKHTLLVYLNDDFTGGETYFPEIDFTVQPVKSTALMFTNIDEQLQSIPGSVHAGLPVVSGTKYACNIWIKP
ncbi:prolyl hydroxylase family protein [Chitinophaga nivalis]|uniref:2OG-Fe(II) oxygenase n=1 Tax=Chitinophaga nivalis TaxID=2991709 RepID=A0ABT3II96_9BACT|nr:2OG-Fe(II) oxygenase [Chitinophaga nivalis]MCW3466650.1 2OG-Fe(II) oxygenase [Chitinophaga nivalis]MCW3483659.1 2OG-Fe(II) oxygenase [Chitinophaga nivalis]